VRSGARPFGGVAGVDVVEYVSHTVEPVAPAASELTEGWDTVIVTSQTAVEQIARDARNADVLRRGLESGTLMAVGEATAEALRQHGLRPDHVAGGSARSMLEGLNETLSGRRVLWPCGEDASLDLSELLKERGAQVRRLVLYRKRPVPANPALSAEILERPPAAFCPTSPAAAEWLFGVLPDAAADRLRKTPAVALGPSTLEKLAALGVERVEVSRDARFGSAADLLARLATAAHGT
jgi:uroporphyrinogen-III synthase